MTPRRFRFRGAAALLCFAGLAAAQAAPSRETAPTPQSWFGRRPAADRFVPSPEALHAYFAASAAASPRVRILDRARPDEPPARSGEGRPLYAVCVSAPRHLARLAEIGDFHRRVAAGAIGEDAAGAADEPAIVLVSAGVHATEPAGVAAAAEAVHRLATEDGQAVRRLLETTIAVFVPCVNPDGLARVREWTERTTDGPFEGTWPPFPAGRYVGHDHNRDAWLLALPESRFLNGLLVHSLAPAVYVDQHQMAPTDARLFVGELASPANATTDPSTLAGVSLLGAYVRASLTADGRRGVMHRANWDGDWQGAFFTDAFAHHVPALLTESAGARLASPLFQRPEDLDGAYRRGIGKDGNAKDWNHPWPWPGGWWRPRDAAEYDLAAIFAALDATSTLRPTLLRLRIAAAKRGLDTGGGGYVFATDGSARERRSGALLSRILALTGAVSYAARDADGRAVRFVPEGQPYAAAVRDLLLPTIRRSAPAPANFDLSAWTAAALCGADVVRVGSPLARDAGSTSAEARPPAAPEKGAHSEKTIAPPASPFRVALYRSWFASDDAGWTRAVLDGAVPGADRRIPHVELRDADLRRGGLETRCDVLIFASEDARVLRDGHSAGSMPEEFCGGIGATGVDALRRFVLGGGRLVCIDRAADFACEIFTREELPVVDAAALLPPAVFSCPGALLALDVDVESPFGADAAPSIVVPFVGSRAFEPTSGGVRGGKPPPEVFARYRAGDPHFAGRALGLVEIAGKAAALRQVVGRGDVVLFGFPVLFRGQTPAAFPLFLRAIRR